MLDADMFGEGAELDHIGLAVRSIDRTPHKGLQSTHDPEQRVNVAFIKVHGTTVELIEPAAEDDPISASLERGTKLVHLCFRVPEIDRAIDAAREWGFRCVRKPVPGSAFENRLIAWLFSDVYGLVELVQAPASSR